MAVGDDPRVFFAAERTLLAWVRSGLAVMGLGFVVARFGLFLQALRHAPVVEAPPGATLIGVGLVLLGSAAVGMGAWQHARFCRTLGPGGRPEPNLATWSIWFSAALAVIGVVLAGYMLVRAETS